MCGGERGPDQPLSAAISKPDLRASLERDLVRICRGETDCPTVVGQAVARYKSIFVDVVGRKDVFLDAVAHNLSNAAAPTGGQFDEVVQVRSPRSQPGAHAAAALIAVRRLPRRGAGPAQELQDPEPRAGLHLVRRGLRPAAPVRGLGRARGNLPHLQLPGLGLPARPSQGRWPWQFCAAER